MRAIGTALQLVFAPWRYRLAGVLTVVLTAAIYTYAGQIVTFYSDGSVYVDTEPTHLAALVLLSLLMGLVLPVQVFALRHAAWRLRQGGTGVAGFIAGISSLSCCSPLILPTILSFAGFSGTSLLTMNYTLYRYFLPLAILSIIFLLLSLLFAAHDVTRACQRPPRDERRAGGESWQMRGGPEWYPGDRRQDLANRRPVQPRSSQRSTVD